VQYTIVFQRRVIDISRWTGSWLWSVQQPPVVHLAKDPREDTMLCGHRWAPGDTIEDIYIDGQAIECAKCKDAASRR
jgi:hypothetical protein